MTSLWVDANVLLRLLTGDPPDMASRALELARSAERGEVRLKLAPLVVAEVVWVLGSFYRFDRRRIAEVVASVVTAEGVEVEQEEEVLAALLEMSDANVDFVDAFLAELARRQDEPVVSFDRDFERLRVRRVEPGQPALS